MYETGFKAKIESDFLTDTLKLVLVQHYGGDWYTFDRDGQREIVSPGTWIPADKGILLPPNSAEAIHKALAMFLGDSIPSVSEIRVLRETLAKEQQRVDRILANASGHGQ